MATYTSPEKYNELKEAIIGGDYGTVTCIVESGYDVNTIDAFLRLPLHYAVLYDQVKIVEYLVSQGAFVRYPPWPKWYTCFTTPFHCAIRKDNLSLAEYLLEKGADIQALDASGETAFHYACRENKLVTLRFLLDHGFNLEASDNSIYFYPIKNGFFEIVSFLIDVGIDLNAKTKYYQQPLFYAIDYGRPEIVKLLIEKGAYVNHEKLNYLEGATEKGFTEIAEILIENQITGSDKALFYAADHGMGKIVKALLENGADLNIRVDRRPLLHAACRGGLKWFVRSLLEQGINTDTKGFNCGAIYNASWGGHPEIIDLLLDKGLALGAVDPSVETIPFYNGVTALSASCRYGQLETVEYLISKGIDVNGGSPTPLFHAAEKGYDQIARLLIENGARFDVSDVTTSVAIEHHKPKKFKEHLLHVACRGGLKWLVEMILATGININTKNDFRETPIMMATRGGHLEIVKLLLLKGAKAHVKNSFTSPIQTAAELGRFDLMEILISHGAKVNTKTISSPLHEAVRTEHKTVVSYLIENGAKMDMQDGNMNTALHIAVEKNNAEIVQLLLKHGVPVNALNKKGNTALDSCKDNECRGLLLLAGAETAASIKG